MKLKQLLKVIPDNEYLFVICGILKYKGFSFLLQNSQYLNNDVKEVRAFHDDYGFTGIQIELFANLNMD